MYNVYTGCPAARGSGYNFFFLEAIFEIGFSEMHSGQKRFVCRIFIEYYYVELWMKNEKF